MTTKLSRYCEGIMEAAWIAAVILVPLFFNTYSSRIFEPDKIAILRSLTLLILAAWIVKLIEERGIHWDRLDPGSSPFKFIAKIPLVAPVIALAVLYIISTIFSVSPRVSLLGSYQRLQGTYTTISYLIIFAALLGNLRKRAQLERLITTIVLVSLPIGLYGILQKYRIDPVPWGGKTWVRIASNMGNSIFVAAYLIMVFPLTLGRIIQSFGAILNEERHIWSNVARATVYVFIAAVQVIALYMSQSRGPALGWMAGAFFLVLLLSLLWNKRWLTFGIIGLAVIAGIFLLLFNLPNVPLDNLRNSPAIGRFGLLLDAQSNSALVRKYIWQGAAELVSIHEPLEFPDGSMDRFNILRPVIGYGPESMYVAYNQFYVPELAQVEQRNASPDRSHNETWDALVITGVSGIVIYLLIFTLVFYYGLKWTGLINTRRQRIAFYGLVLAIGGIAGIGFSLWRGAAYFGVGLPFGMLFGLLAYLALFAMLGSFEAPRTKGEFARSLTLVILIAAIVAHFVEINFGIAIVATRTYFWVYTGILVVAGYIMPMYGEFVEKQEGEQASEKAIRKRKRRSRRISGMNKRGAAPGIVDAMVPAMISAIIMVTLGYDFISNPKRLDSPLEILSTSFTRLPQLDYSLSYGILALIITTWIFMAVVMTSEYKIGRERVSWWITFGYVLGISTVVTLVYWLWQASILASIAGNPASDLTGIMEQVRRYENLLSNYYLYVFAIILALAAFLVSVKIRKERGATLIGVASAGVALVLVLIVGSYTNLRVIQADMAFKLAEPFSRGEQLPIALEIYDHATALAPNEDYYYLFTGRAYLEYAKTLEDENERDNQINQAISVLERAQIINPLNTDHTANLARLYSLWASYNTSEEAFIERANTSDDYFETALVLSPNNARLWDEWSLFYLNVLNQPDEAFQRLSHSADVDPDYHWTYALLGEYYSLQSQGVEDEDERRRLLTLSAENFERALELRTPGEPQAKYNYAIALGGAHTQLGNIEKAIVVYLDAIERAPAGVAVWRIHDVLASLYVQIEDYGSAIIHAQNALISAPEDQAERIQLLIAQLQQLQQ